MSISSNDAALWKNLVQVVDTRDVVVSTDINSFPVFHEEFTLPYFVIKFCIQGTASFRYDLHSIQDCPHTVTVLQPGHIFHAESVSDDFHQAAVVVSKHMYDEWRKFSGKAFIQLNQTPSFQYTPEQAEKLKDAVHLLRTVAQSVHPEREMALLSILQILCTMVGIYSEKQVPDQSYPINRGEEIFVRFHDMLMKHYTEARDIAFYANKLFITPKYFSAIILKTTGISALDWITGYIITKAKLLLKHHNELSIQDVCYQLGFNEQAAFSRYFKRATGLTPTQYRNECTHKP